MAFEPAAEHFILRTNTFELFCFSKSQARDCIQALCLLECLSEEQAEVFRREIEVSTLPEESALKALMRLNDGSVQEMAAPVTERQEPAHGSREWIARQRDELEARWRKKAGLLN